MRSTAHIVFTTVCVVILLFVVQPLIFFRNTEVFEIFYNMFVVLMYLVCCLCFILCTNYVARLQKSFQSINLVKTKLLDNLHDGILILSKSDADSQVLYHNRQARKFVNTMILQNPNEVSKNMILPDLSEFMSVLAFKPIPEN